MVNLIIRIATIVAAGALALTTIVFFASLGAIILQVLGVLPSMV